MISMIFMILLNKLYFGVPFFPVQCQAQSRLFSLTFGLVVGSRQHGKIYLHSQRNNKLHRSVGENKKKYLAHPAHFFISVFVLFFAYSSMEGQLHLIMPPEVAGFTEWFNSLTWLMNEANVNGFISNGLCVSADKAESSG